MLPLTSMIKLTSSAELGVVFLLILFQLEMFPPCMYSFFTNLRLSPELDFPFKLSFVMHSFMLSVLAIFHLCDCVTEYRRLVSNTGKQLPRGLCRCTCHGKPLTDDLLSSAVLFRFIRTLDFSNNQ